MQIIAKLCIRDAARQKIINLPCSARRANTPGRLIIFCLAAGFGMGFVLPAFVR